MFHSLELKKVYDYWSWSWRLAMVNLDVSVIVGCYQENIVWVDTEGVSGKQQDRFIWKGPFLCSMKPIHKVCVERH